MEGVSSASRTVVPAHQLEFPTDILGNSADVEIIGPRDPGIPQGDPAKVEQALQVLLNAKRPAIVVGEEVQMLGGTEEIVRLAEALGAPVVTSDGAKGAFPEDHPLSLGTMLGGRIWGENPAQKWLSTCDAVVILGSIMPHRSTTGVQLNLPGTVVHVLLDGDYIGKNYDATVPIVANSQAVAQQWLEGIGGRDVSKGQSYADEVASVKKDIHRTLQETWGNELKVFEAVREAAPRDTVFSLDPTVPASRASRCLDIYGPRKYMHPHGWAGLGFAFPAGLGAKVGQPDSPVVCITGDGGFQYNFQELAPPPSMTFTPDPDVQRQRLGVMKGTEIAFGDRLFALPGNHDFSKRSILRGRCHPCVTVAELARPRYGVAFSSSRVEVAIPTGRSAGVGGDHSPALD